MGNVNLAVLFHSIIFDVFGNELSFNHFDGNKIMLEEKLNTVLKLLALW
jgi:hypothetical protein